MLILQNITYSHPDKENLFNNLGFSLQSKEKAALLGHNGSGKSTLLRIMADWLHASEGIVHASSPPFYVPQHYGSLDDLSLAQALQIQDKLQAMKAILEGDVSEINFTLLNDDWGLEERCAKALDYWELHPSIFSRDMKSLSGGEKTRAFLAGIQIHEPEIVLLDEPTNHLDTRARNIFYDFLLSFSGSCLVVSHDRHLLGMLSPVYELEKGQIKAYGGSYSFYREQKQMEESAVESQIRNQGAELRKAKKIQREAAEREQKHETRGKKSSIQSGIPRIAMKTLKNQAESSAAKLKEAHEDKTRQMADELKQSQERLSASASIQMNFENSNLHQGKILIKVQCLQYAFGNRPLWKTPLSFEVRSGERIHLQGMNGTGKTTLIKILLGQLKPQKGSVQSIITNSVYFDQDYSLISGHLTVYEQAGQFNHEGLQEHEIKIRLHRFLFHSRYWDKPCNTLSGGEKMRLMLCCLMIANKAPDIFILDEPTNNLDIQNIEILTRAINAYKGTLIVVSHDRQFLKEVQVARELMLE